MEDTFVAFWGGGMSFRFSHGASKEWGDNRQPQVWIHERLRKGDFAVSRPANQMASLAHHGINPVPQNFRRAIKQSSLNGQSSSRHKNDTKRPDREVSL